MLQVHCYERPEATTETGDTIPDTDQFLLDIEVKGNSETATAVREKITSFFEQLTSEFGGRTGGEHRAETILMVE